MIQERETTRAPRVLGVTTKPTAAIDNRLLVVVELDELPEFRYSKIGEERRYLYAASAGGFHKAYVYDSSDRSGHGGRQIELPMLDGTVASIVGPWTASNSEFAAWGFPRCCAVELVTSTSEYFDAVNALAEEHVLRSWLDEKRFELRSDESGLFVYAKGGDA